MQLDSILEAWYQLGRYWMAQDKLSKPEISVEWIQIDPSFQKPCTLRNDHVIWEIHNQGLYQTAIAQPFRFTHYNLNYFMRPMILALKNSKAIEEKPDHVEANLKLICMKNNIVNEAILF